MARAKPIECDEMGLAIAELAFDFARSGLRGVNPVLAAIQKELPELNLTREQLVDHIVGYQQAQAKREVDEAQKALAELKSEAKSDRTAREAIDRMENIIKGLPEDAVTPKQRAQVRKALKELRREQQALRQKINAKERAKVVEGKLKRGDLSTKPKQQGPKEQLIARRDELNRQLQQARNNKKRAEAIQEELAKLNEQIQTGEFDQPTTKERPPVDPELARLRKIARLMQQNIDMARQLATGNIRQPKKRTPDVMDDNIDRLMFERDLLRAEINQAIRDAQPIRGWSRVAEAFNVSRAVLTSMDLSALLRQGGFISFGNPARAAKALGVGLRSVASHVPFLKKLAGKNYARDLQREMIMGDGARARERAGLHVSRIEGDLAAQEEAVATNLVQRLAGRKVTIKNFPFVLGAKAVQASQEAYTVMLNKLRVDTYDAMVRALDNPTLDEMKAVANYVNVATGRPKLNQTLERSADLMNTVFFAPRYALSRFQLLGGQPLWKNAFNPETKTAARARRLILKEYGKYAVGILSALGLGLLAGGVIERDRRSSDFGKLRFGNTRLDLASGLIQPIVMMSRLMSGEQKQLKDGKIRKSGIYPLVGFLRSKLSPLASTMVDIAARTNIIGENTDVSTADGRWRVLSRLFVPISFGEAVDAIAEQGVPRGTVFTLFNLLGAGTQTFDSNRDAKKD